VLGPEAFVPSKKEEAMMLGRGIKALVREPVVRRIRVKEKL